MNSDAAEADAPGRAIVHTPPQLPDRYDSGVLVVHGVGDHAPTSSLQSFVEPFMARMQAEGSLRNAVTLELGTAVEDGGPFEAVHLRYSTDETASDRHLLVVEGLWSGLYRRSSVPEVSAWIYVVQRPMLWALSRYYARGPLHFLWSSVVVAAFGAAAGALISGNPGLALAFTVGGFASGLLKAYVADARAISTGGWRARLMAIPASAVFFVYQIQRALATVWVVAGSLLLYVVMPLLRLLASIPLAGRFSWWAFGKVESAFLATGAADMEAIANDHVAAAAVRARLRAALVALESKVRPGGDIVVVAHSGGAVPAWRLLSEPEMAERIREGEPSHRYSLITVGAALNWTRHELGKRGSTPLDGSLVTTPQGRTRWLNVYATWDPVPHGPVEGGTMPETDTWGDDWNRMVRNLGAPVPDEHGEYWKNQEEFVPLLGRAVDPELPWLSNALDDTRPRQWTLTRLGMLSAITRVRFTLVAAAVSAAVIFAAGFVSDTSNMFDYVADRGHSWFGAELLSLDCRDGLGTCNEDGFSLDVVQAMHEEDWLANAVGLGVLLFLSYVAMTVYTNMFWGPLARGGLPFGRIGQLQIGPPGWVFPWRDVLRMEIPTVLVPLAPIAVGLREPVFWIVLAVSAVMALLEVVWLSLCYLALRSDATGVFRGFGAAVGRGQDQKSAPLPTIEKSRVAT